ncbi:MAG: 3-dehydroquinate synthase [Candidatus Omnitrophica bacterium]|nr:3-dehydroquinate synthase [Candidatus Omnitrophota bacterium]
MPSISVDLKENSYTIEVGAQNLKDLGKAVKALGLGEDAIVITHACIANLHGEAILEGLEGAGISVKILEVPEGESSKSAAMVMDLVGKVAEYDVKRKIFLVAFGGGVIGDLVGFVAAVYRRGIPYIQVPTTLLAQIDSSIGGKVGIDLPVGKNLVGAFYQPRIVWSDVNLLSTLDQRQIRNGLAEAIKYGVICDRNLFEMIEELGEKLVQFDAKNFTHLVLECSRIKGRIVVNDERETKGIRTILNFGHTIGHAIEAADQYQNYQHGEAVALGMRVALDISRRLELVDSVQVVRVNQVISKVGLPEKIMHVTLPEIMSRMQHDKKFKGKTNRFVLATGIGSVKIVEGVDPLLIQMAIEACM